MAQIVGWALVNSQLKTALYYRTQEKIASLRAAGLLPAAARVCVGQICLDSSHRGKGLMPWVYGQLYRQLAERYDLYFATILRSNLPSLRYHVREGYTLVAEDAEKQYFTDDIPHKAAMLPSSATIPVPYRVRQGQPTDAAHLHALNQRWSRAALGDDLAGGFLTTVYSEEEFRAIIAVNEIAIIETVQ